MEKKIFSTVMTISLIIVVALFALSGVKTQIFLVGGSLLWTEFFILFLACNRGAKKKNPQAWREDVDICLIAVFILTLLMGLISYLRISVAVAALATVIIIVLYILSSLWLEKK